MHIDRVRILETMDNCPKCHRDISGHPDYPYCPYCKESLTRQVVVGELASEDQGDAARILKVLDSEIRDQISALPAGSVIDLNTSLVDLGVDSLREVEIIMAIEEEFDIDTIPDEYTEAFPSFLIGGKTIRDFVKAVITYLSSLTPATP